MIMADHPFPGKWQWWAGWNDDEMTVGPCEDRAGIIQTAREDGVGIYRRGPEYTPRTWRAFHIVEGLQDNMDLAAQFSVTDWLETVRDETEEMASADGDHPLDVIATDEEKRAELQAVVRAAIREWQVRHGLKLTGYGFADSRNDELIDEPVID